MKELTGRITIATLVFALAGVAYWWWTQPKSAEQMQGMVVAPVQSLPPAPPLPTEPVAEAVSAIRHPIAPLASSDNATEDETLTLEASDEWAKNALNALLGQKTVLGFLVTSDFVRNFVATVDNLARDQAPARLWPVLPTPGRVAVTQQNDGLYLAEGNADRYTKFIGFATAVDTKKAAALYFEIYPLFQQAYEELGFPGKYFNDRLVEVIDQLLATPEPTVPVKLTLTKVKGTVPSTRPWLRYEFDDPLLQEGLAGQKILMRMGPKNANLLKAKLREIRKEIAAPSEK